MNKKSVLINAGMVTNQPSGVGVYSLELLKELVPTLQREGYKFIIYCYEPTIIEKLNIGNVKRISLGYLLDRLLKNKEVIHRHIWNIIVLNFISCRYNILYSFTSHGTLFHRKQIITIHDVICLSFPNSHKGQYYYFKYFLPLLIKQTKHIISISNFTKNEVVDAYSLDDKKVSVIYNGIDHLEKLKWFEKDEEWVEKITDKKPFCICVGASYPHKNIETLLSVCDKMKNLDIKFLIINKPNTYYNSLRDKVEEMELKNVIFLPFVESSRLAVLYKMARLNIYLSLYEGFGFPPAEASFFKTQSLLSNQAALVEVYGEGCEYTEPFDIDNIEKIVLKYALSEKKLETDTYCKLREKYNWKKAAEQTFRLFNSI
ncbi:glycosyltransferase family 4 protein [Segetibacter koreensis]|uniref:glycosyltransferase family 4 protein n=1 Tax=Segetibacter koreensis TaxID=398037 RepID=UPI00037C4BD4|nr:glycosyltransferase family 1 protein [Segetibacter koreensis]